MTDGSQAAPPPGERRDGRQLNLVATGLLLLAALLFAATFLDPAPDFWTLLLRSVTEASMVGGIADWFAVVALFQHPLGIPIPHTAVIPNNKDRIARGLSRFVETHVLEPSSVAGQLRRADLARVSISWLAQPENAALVAERLSRALAALVASIPDAELMVFVRRAALRGLSTLDFAGLLATAAQMVHDTGRHQEVFDAVVGKSRRWIAENPGRLRRLVEERTAWWVPRAVDRGLSRAVAEQASVILDEFQDPECGLRRELDAMMARLADDLRHTPKYRERIAAIQRDLMNAEQLHRALDDTALQLRQLVLEDLAEPQSAIRDAVARAILSLAVRLEGDEDARQRLERRVIWMVRTTVHPWRERIGRFIAEVMRGWEAKTLSERLRRAVGRDLQYIRINGTLVGGLVGGVLFLLTQALR